MILIKYTLYNFIVFQNVVLVGFQKLQFLFLFVLCERICYIGLHDQRGYEIS